MSNVHEMMHDNFIFGHQQIKVLKCSFQQK